MKDLLNKEVKVGDIVVHIFPNQNGKQSLAQGIVTGFNKKGAIIVTQNGIRVAKNIVLLQRNIRNINIFDFLKQVFH